MLLKRRKQGSQRPMQALEAEIIPILSSHEVEITFLAGGIYYSLQPQTTAEAEMLHDDAGIVLVNRRRKEQR